MDLSARDRVQHALRTALTKVTLSLQVLERHTSLSEEQRQLVNVSRQGVVELDAILRDDVQRQLIGLSTVPNGH